MLTDWRARLCSPSRPDRARATKFTDGCLQSNVCRRSPLPLSRRVALRQLIFAPPYEQVGCLPRRTTSLPLLDVEIKDGGGYSSQRGIQRVRTSGISPTKARNQASLRLPILVEVNMKTNKILYMLSTTILRSVAVSRVCCARRGSRYLHSALPKAF
jgi:hypothetical protein